MCVVAIWELSNELRRGVTEEPSLGLFFGEVGDTNPTFIGNLHWRRLNTVIPQPLVVGSFLVSILFACDSYSLKVFYSFPSVESVLGDHVITQVPLTHVGVVILVVNHVSNGLDIARKWNAVSLKPSGMRVETSHDRSARRCTNWLSHVRVLEHEAFLRQLVEIRSLDPVVSIGAH